MFREHMFLPGSWKMALSWPGLSASNLEETFLWFTSPLGSAETVKCLKTPAASTEMETQEGEMQRDGESCPSVVYFHMNIPGVDSYSLVWRAELQCNFPDSRQSVQTPTNTGPGQWRMERISYSRFHLGDSSWKWECEMKRAVFTPFINPAAQWRGETCG